MNRKTCLAALLAVLAASSAAAQDKQTVDSAQTFLVSVMPSAQMRIQGDDVDGWETWGDILDWNKAGRCGFEFSADHPPSEDWSNGVNEGTRNYMYVAAVSYTGGMEVRVAYSDAAMVDYYQFTSDTMAGRVARAMEFLRANCDATADTGF